MIKINTYYIKQGQTSIFNKLKIKDNTCEIKSKLNKTSKIKRVVEKMIQNKIEYVILSNELKDNNEFIDTLLYTKKIRIFDGKWLFNYLIVDILEYLKDRFNLDENTEIAILSNNVSEEISGNIEELCEKYKKIKIVTEHFEKFKKIEERIYSNTGFPLVTTNNKKKALNKVEIIINFDLDEDGINKFNIFENAIIINLSNKIKINKKRFNGIIISDYNITSNSKEVEESKVFFKSLKEKRIDEANLSKFQIIRRIIKEENIKINSLIARNQVV